MPDSQSDPDIAPVIAELLHTAIARSELIRDTPAHTLRRVELANGRVIGVKQYAHGRHYAVEGAALREVEDAVPLPAIVCTLDRVIAYRWIDGITLDDYTARDPQAARTLAAPLGRMLGALTQLRREPSDDTRASDVAQALALLAAGDVREQLGAPLAGALHGRLTAHRFDDPRCFVHGRLTGDRVIVTPAQGGAPAAIAGVIGWTAAGHGSCLADAGSLIRDADRYDAALCDELARGHGSLPADWVTRARLLDAARSIAALPSQIGELRARLTRLVDAVTGDTPRSRA